MRGFEGGLPGPPFWGCRRKLFYLCCLIFRVASIFVSIVGRIFGTWFFAGGFQFPVKELELLTNPGNWVRVFDSNESYMYFLL